MAQLAIDSARLEYDPSQFSLHAFGLYVHEVIPRIEVALRRDNVAVGRCNINTSCLSDV